MRKFTTILLTFLMLGCAKKELKIPILAEKGIQEIQNHSQVWLFFEVKNNDTVAVVNRKNTISTTHWIYNIDKRLPLKVIIPAIINLQNKHANSMHSEKGMFDYFSYSDTISKKLSFLKFDGVTFKTIDVLSKNFLEENAVNNPNSNNIQLVFNQNKVLINAVETNQSNFKNELTALLKLSDEGKQPMLHLNFNRNLLYQDYLFYRTIIHNLSNENILVNRTEIIFGEYKD
ncbi:MAG: hypothetical protein RQ864_05510 [Lutibacter sp.]|nr:hypothetical protein [Lutibacter sp.]MDT8417249.1 hypothetical protein [Lutibacter sp.]